MAIVATNLKRGQCIQYEGERGVVLGLEHRTPGKGNALMKIGDRLPIAGLFWGHYDSKL